MTMTAPQCTVRCLAGAGDDPVADAFVFDAPDVDPTLAAAIILTTAGEARAETLLAAGAACVLVGEAALLDSTLIERLATRHGSTRIGVYVPARRLEVQWSFDTTSNADFRVVTPSVCEPSWEVLRADGGGTGALAGWWIGEMIKRGASLALVRADIRDDADLNICAGLVEDCGERLWLGPLDDPAPRLDEWVAYGQLRRIALPPDQFQRYEQQRLAEQAVGNDLAEAA
jgi:hypothetical protein